MVSESWPGWLQVLPSFGLSCAACFSSSQSGWIDGLLQAHPSCLRFTLPQLLLSLLEVTDPVWCFIQGSLALLPFLPPAWPERFTVIWSLSQPSIGLPGDIPWQSSSTLLHHTTYGGVIAGAWRLISNIPALFPLPLPSNVIERRMCHVVDKTRLALQCVVAPPRSVSPVVEHGVSWLEMGGYPCIDWEGLLPSTDLPNVLLYCPSVYSDSGWVVRPLTALELMSAYDVSETLVPTSEWKLHSTHSLPFLDATPSRILSAVLEHLTSPHVETRAVAKPPLVLAWPTVEGLEWQGPPSSTTKSDDAEVPKQIWNERVLRVGYSKTTYEEFEKRYNCNPLDSVHSYLLHVWRRRVWQSLRVYLNQRYGTQWRHKSQAQVEREVGRDCLYRASQASWWEWCLGSTPFFWRWPLGAQGLL